MLDETGSDRPGARDLDRVFHALADPGRRAMLEQLCERPATVSELARPMAMTLAAVVQHVQVLESCGLVRTRKQGRQRTCTLNAPALRSAEHWISRRRWLWEQRLDQLGEYLRATEPAPDVDVPDAAEPRAAASTPPHPQPAKRSRNA